MGVKKNQLSEVVGGGGGLTLSVLQTSDFAAAKDSIWLVDSAATAGPGFITATLSTTPAHGDRVGIKITDNPSPPSGGMCLVDPGPNNIVGVAFPFPVRALTGNPTLIFIFNSETSTWDIETSYSDFLFVAPGSTAPRLVYGSRATDWSILAEDPGPNSLIGTGNTGGFGTIDMDTPGVVSSFTYAHMTDPGPGLRRLSYADFAIGQRTLVPWHTATQAGNFTALSNFGYRVNPTAAPVTVQLPAVGGLIGDETVRIEKAFATANDVTIDGNGADIVSPLGTAASFILDVDYGILTLQFDQYASRWKIVARNYI